MDIEKRVLLAVFLIAVVLVLSNMFLVPPPPETEPVAGGDRGPEVTDTTRLEPRAEEPVIAERLGPIPGGAEVAGDTVRVETDLYDLEISTAGGRLISVVLRDYPAWTGDGGVSLIPPVNSSFMGLRVTFDKDTLDLSRMNFDPSADRIDARARQGTLILSHPVGERDSIKMIYTFAPGEYLIGATLVLPGVTRSRDMDLQVDLLPRLMPTEVDSVKNDINYFGTVMGGVRGDVEEVAIRHMKQEDGGAEYRDGPFLWAAVKNKYFIAALISKAAPIKGVVSKGTKEERKIGLTATIPLGETGGRVPMELYVGPQDYYRLSAIGVGMEDVVQYGWWIIRPFTRMVLVILLWMHQFISNYGIVIILFSVATKVAFYPLTKKSLKASQDLQRVQPLLKELREKYKKEPQKLQQETMKIYREHKVNPLGGCLPMLIQMPVLWALFYVFRMTIEFRGAGFGLWINDLSAPDSPPVLPVVMGLSMFLQQKLNPQSADPKMAPMMYVMPVVLTIIFINFPAGLVLYWTINNFLAIAQQYLILRRGAPAPATRKPSNEPA